MQLTSQYQSIAGDVKMMSMHDFGFMYAREKATAAGATGKAARNLRSQCVRPLRAPEACSLTVNEGERLLRIISQTSGINRHYDLFQWLQGAEIQHFIPHQVLICAWGEIGEPNLKFDVTSPMPGARTALMDRRTLEELLKDLYQRWLANGRQPLLLDNARVAMAAGYGCAIHKFLQDTGTLLVHGVVDARDGSHSLYVALNTGSIVNSNSAERFGLLADMLITQIDVAYRRIAALKSPAMPVERKSVLSAQSLSPREQEILRWVTEGKSNNEIAKILAISMFTVKNHMQRIMKKLDAANRTEAVAMFRQNCLAAA